MDRNNFSDRVIEILEERGWDISDLSDESGLLYSTLHSVLKRGHEPKLQTILGIFTALGVRVVGFDKGDAVDYMLLKGYLDEETEEILDITSKMELERRQSVLNYVKYLKEQNKE